LARLSIALRQQLPLTQDSALTTRGRSVLTWLPIHAWSDTQVWQQIADSALPYSSIYDQGMSRLSCSFCVLASEGDLVCAARLRPRMAAVYADLEARIGHRFKADLTMADILTQAQALGPIAPQPRGTAMRRHLGDEATDAYLLRLAS
jgi:3'-phosphoadenosine 5'-phosphosulfate sulfotransferase (PAPS reductase)/FAD synthetase